MGDLRFGKAVWSKQDQFLKAPSTFLGFCGGRGVGKTEVGSIYLLLHAKTGEPWMCVSPDANVIEDTTWPTFRTVAEQLGRWIRGVRSPVHRATFRTQDGGTAEVVFRSAEKPDKLRGPSKAGLWLDEASIMAQDVFHFGLPVLRWKGRMGKCLLTFTPKGRKHWSFGVFFEEAEGDIAELLNSPDGARLVEDADRYRQFGGKWYRYKDDTTLIQAHSSENPFLPREYVHAIGGHLTASLRAQELAGEFVDIMGLLFSREWFYPLVDAVPKIAQRVRYWDFAGSTPEERGKFTAGVLMARTQDGLFWIEDVQRGQWSPNERNRIVLETARKDAMTHGNVVRIYAEQEGGSAGKEIMQQFIKMLAGFPVYRDIVSGQRSRVKDGQRVPGQAKIDRAVPFAAQAEARNVRMKRAGWNEDLLGELTEFPEGVYSDQVDGCSGALNKLSAMWAAFAGASDRLESTHDGHLFGIDLRGRPRRDVDRDGGGRSDRKA